MKLAAIVSGWLIACSSLCRAATPEQEMQFAAQDAVAYLARSGALAGREDVDAYLQSVLQKLVTVAPVPEFSGCRIHLTRADRPSAYALPNCRLYVSSALFLLLENDAQLAVLLSRELAHVQQHSAVRYRETLKQAWTGAHLLALGLAVGVPGTQMPASRSNYPAMTGAVGDLLWRVSVRGYSAELESAADRVGLERLVAAGYEPADARRVFRLLLKAAPEEPKGYVASDHWVPLLSSQKYLKTRSDSLDLLAGNGPIHAAPADAKHRSLVASLRLMQVQVLIDAHEPEAARRELGEHIAVHGQSGWSHYFAGELARRAGPGSRDAALVEYEQGAKFADAPAALFLNQGMLLRQAGEAARARVAFERYLELDPDSLDARIIRDYLGKSASMEE